MVFNINGQERIILFLSSGLDDIFRYDDVSAVYIKDNICEQIIHQEEDILEFVDVLNSSLEFALRGKNKISTLLGKNIGYLWNVYLHKFYGDCMNKKEPDWGAKESRLWDTRETASWLYEKDGKFYFEITPVYKWIAGLPDPEEKSEYVTYKQFMKNYKSYPSIVAELSVEILHRWQEQTKYLLALIRLSDEAHGIITPEILKMSEMWVEMQKKKND